MITFEDHPARIIKDGQPVPAVPSQRMIRVNGEHAGYCGTQPGKPVSRIRSYSSAVIEKVSAAVEEAYGKPSSVSMPPDLGELEGWH